jgi:prepilin-type N-terminal cleavage/methylation domain-containing protein/prepilin-type processing-associated H-X9-DG protein
VNRIRNAFTLIELLVVIAIIAILAAILFPVFAQARESARQTSCLSNTKQLGLGILQYVQDYDEKFPLWIYVDDPRGNNDPNKWCCAPANTTDTPWGPWKLAHYGWDKTVQPYVKNVQIFQCPSNSEGPNRSASTNDSDATGAVHYALNGHLSLRDGNASTQNLASVRFPAVTILLAENSKAGSTGETTADVQWMEWGYNQGHPKQLNGDAGLLNTWDANDNGNQINALCHQGENNTQQWGQTSRLRAHKGGGNYAFVDGHSKWYQGTASCVVWDRGNVGGVPRNESGSTITYIP